MMRPIDEPWANLPPPGSDIDDDDDEIDDIDHDIDEDVDDIDDGDTHQPTDGPPPKPADPTG